MSEFTVFIRLFYYVKKLHHYDAIRKEMEINEDIFVKGSFFRRNVFDNKVRKGFKEK